jgi:trimethylamine--corrinoid protein Co-methyltransferase
MISGQYWDLFDDGAAQQLDAAAVQLLEKGGVRVHHKRLLAQLAAAGCRTSTTDGRCRVPEKLVREAVSRLGGRAHQGVELPVGWNPQHRLSHGGSHPHILEWPECRRRLATRRDVCDMAMMAHVLDEFDRVGKVLTCSEVDQRVEPLWATLQVAQITDKPIGGGEIFYADYVEPLMRMAEVLTGKPDDTTLIAACDCFIAPLTLDGAQAECFLEKRRLGIENVPCTMPISGLSAPVTVAGTVAVALAELLAGWVLGYVVRPDLPAGGIAASGSLDMRTATPSFGSPEALLQDCAVVQVCRRLYGIEVWAATTYVDAKTPGLEAAFQKMLPLAAAPFGTGLGVGGDGLLSAGQDYSPVQQLLEHEMAKAVERLVGTFETSDETLAVELILDRLGGPSTNFVETEHTLRHFRSEQWYPRWLDRSLWRGEQQERDAEHRMLAEIDRYCRDAIASYEPPQLDRPKIEELRRIFLSAEKRLLGANTTPLP